MSWSRRKTTGAPRAFVQLALVAAVAVCAPSVARAADPPSKTSPADAAEAEKHFAHARELYQQGAYREAIGELDTALALDPNGKGLVFNLGVVHEKLGDIDDALKYFLRYEQMDLEPQERAKADAYVKRLQGARHEVEKPPEPATAPQATAAPPPPPPQHGRIDALTLGAASLAVLGFGVGTYFGLRALAERPSLTAGVPYAQYVQVQSDATRAHHAAIVSDVGFATGLVTSGLAAYLYFGRTKRPGDATNGGKTSLSAPPVVVYAATLPRGVAFVLDARF